MPKTIEDRLTALTTARIANDRRDTDETFYDLITIKAAIIAGWNAAEKAMGKYISDWYWRDGDEWQCGICHAANNWHEEWHIPGSCYVASFQVAIAQMEGN